MRHFNELDHELQARLNRAYRPAVRYMESFSSPMGAVIARCICNYPLRLDIRHILDNHYFFLFLVENWLSYLVE